MRDGCGVDVALKGLTQFETAKHLSSRFSRFTWSLCSAKSWIKHAHYRFALRCHLVENTGIQQMTFLQQVLRSLKQFGMLEQGHHSNILLLHGFLCVKTKTQEAVHQGPRSRISESAENFLRTASFRMPLVDQANVFLGDRCPRPDMILDAQKRPGWVRWTMQGIPQPFTLSNNCGTTIPMNRGGCSEMHWTQCHQTYVSVYIIWLYIYIYIPHLRLLTRFKQLFFYKAWPFVVAWMGLPRT